ncbi:MAG TPA: methionyl-tRNA formyltransferase [Candidatus Acidoferrales bacterium]|nr:methionyl-tRNA formyltransferase [Candidatus Acidoferrales bacterium]
MPPLRIVFCGTPAFALPTLRALLVQSEFKVEGVVTQPDRPRGRGQVTSSSPVKDAAVAAGIPVYQPQKIRAEEAYEYFRNATPDVIVIIAYGQIIPARLIAIPRLGWINLHGSLLPKYRGAAPIHWAIASGETRTGLTTMQIDAGLDTGPMLLQHETEIAPDETASQLYLRLAEAGAPLMTETLRGLARGTITPTPQDNSQATLAPPLKREDGRIRWSLPAQEIFNRIRGFQPWPGAFTTFRGKQCAIWGKPALSDTTARTSALAPGAIRVESGEVDVVCGESTTLRLEFVQLEGRKRIVAREFANGARLAPGERFGS